MFNKLELLKQASLLLSFLSEKHASFCTGKEEDSKNAERYYTAFNHAVTRFDRRFNELSNCNRYKKTSMFSVYITQRSGVRQYTEECAVIASNEEEAKKIGKCWAVSECAMNEESIISVSAYLESDNVICGV